MNINALANIFGIKPAEMNGMINEMRELSMDSNSFVALQKHMQAAQFSAEAMLKQENLTPRINFFMPRKENQIDMLTRLYCKYVGPIKAKEIKSFINARTIAEMRKCVSLIDGGDIQDTTGLYFNLVLGAFKNVVPDNENLTELASSDWINDYAKLLTANSSETHRSQALLFLSMALELAKDQNYLSAVNPDRPDHDVINVAFMLCMLMYINCENLLAFGLVFKILRLDPFADRISFGDVYKKLTALGQTKPLFFFWEPDTSAVGFRMEDSLNVSVNLGIRTRLDSMMTPEQIHAANLSVLHSCDMVYMLKHLDSASSELPTVYLLADLVRDWDGLTDRVRAVRNQQAAAKFSRFVDENKGAYSDSKLASVFKPRLNTVTEAVASSLSSGRDRVEEFKTDFKAGFMSLAVEALANERQIVKAQHAMDFNCVAECALHLDTLKQNLEQAVLDLESRYLHVAETKAEEATESAPVKTELHELYEEEIQVLRSKLAIAEQREQEMRARFEELYAQTHRTDYATCEPVDHCFTQPALNFMMGIASVAEAVDVINLLRPDVVFYPGVRESLESSLYAKPERLLRGLIQLCEYHKAIAASTPDSVARDILGNNYSANESESVMSCQALRQMRQFRSHDGERVEMQQHLTIGSRNGEAYTIQVHFRIIDGVLYIGRIGSHLPNSSKH